MTTTRITFWDHNQHRDNAVPFEYEGRDVRIIYNHVWDETTIIASYIDGIEPDGSGDGWRVEATRDLYSDIDLGGNG